MGNKSNIKCGLICFMVILSFFGCSTLKVRPGAERVIVSQQVAPLSCQLKGQVVGTQGSAFTAGLTSNKSLSEGAVIDMKNQALDLGANYVQIEIDPVDKNLSSNLSKLGGGISQHQTNVKPTGNAYKCNLEFIRF